MTFDDERGFTLVELLVASVIVGIIMSAMATAIIVGLRTTDEANTRFSESHDAQIASAYFVTDVQSADSVTTTDNTCSGVNNVLRLRWTDNAGVKDAAYYINDATGQHRLSRAYCVGGSLQSTLTIVHFLSATAPPTVTCTPTCGASTSVAITVTEPSGYAYSLSAARRATG